MRMGGLKISLELQWVELDLHAQPPTVAAQRDHGRD